MVGSASGADDGAVISAVLAGVVAVGSGLVGGVMFAFSTAVMPGLGRRPDDQGAAAMQVMNRAILNPLFLAAFLGTAVASVVLIVVGDWTGRLAGLAYLLGVFGVTMVVNVPLNNRLDAADAGSSAGGELWRHYLRRWTAWNHARAVAATVAAALAVA